MDRTEIVKDHRWLLQYGVGRASGEDIKKMVGIRRMWEAKDILKMEQYGKALYPIVMVWCDMVQNREDN